MIGRSPCQVCESGRPEQSVVEQQHLGRSQTPGVVNIRHVHRPPPHLGVQTPPRGQEGDELGVAGRSCACLAGGTGHCRGRGCRGAGCRGARLSRARLSPGAVVAGDPAAGAVLWPRGGCVRCRRARATGRPLGSRCDCWSHGARATGCRRSRPAPASRRASARTRSFAKSGTAGRESAGRPARRPTGRRRGCRKQCRACLSRRRNTAGHWFPRTCRNRAPQVPDRTQHRPSGMAQERRASARRRGRWARRRVSRRAASTTGPGSAGRTSAGTRGRTTAGS